MEERTIDSIIAYFDSAVAEKKVLSPHDFVEAAQYLNVLIGGEHDKLYKLEQDVAKMKVAFIRDGDSVASANVKVEAEDVYREYRMQRARIGQIEEFIRISKVQAKLKDNEMHNY